MDLPDHPSVLRLQESAAPTIDGLDYDVRGDRSRNVSAIRSQYSCGDLLRLCNFGTI